MTASPNPTPTAPHEQTGATDKRRTAAHSGRLWGTRAQDWADLQERQFSAAYNAVFDACALGRDTRYCDVGCGAGMVAMLASERDARVSGLDAAESLLTIARARVPSGDFRVGDLEDQPNVISRWNDISNKTGLALGSEVAAEVVHLRANDGRSVALAPYVSGTAAGQFHAPTRTRSSGTFLRSKPLR